MTGIITIGGHIQEFHITMIVTTWWNYHDQIRAIRHGTIVLMSCCPWLQGRHREFGTWWSIYFGFSLGCSKSQYATEDCKGHLRFYFEKRKHHSMTNATWWSTSVCPLVAPNLMKITNYDLMFFFPQNLNISQPKKECKFT